MAAGPEPLLPSSLHGQDVSSGIVSPQSTPQLHSFTLDGFNAPEVCDQQKVTFDLLTFSLL